MLVLGTVSVFDVIPSHGTTESDVGALTGDDKAVDDLTRVYKCCGYWVQSFTEVTSAVVLEC